MKAETSCFSLPILSILSLFLCFSYCELCDECKNMHSDWFLLGFIKSEVSFHEWINVVSLRCVDTTPIGWVSVWKPGLSCLPHWYSGTCCGVGGVNRRVYWKERLVHFLWLSCLLSSSNAILMIYVSVSFLYMFL